MINRMLINTYSNRDFLSSLIKEIDFVLDSCKEGEMVIFINDIYGINIESKCENLVIFDAGELELSVIRARLSQMLSPIDSRTMVHLIFTNPTLVDVLELNFGENIKTRAVVDVSEYGTGGYTFNYTVGDVIKAESLDKGSTFRRVVSRSSSVLEIFSVLEKLMSTSIGPVILLNDSKVLQIKSKNEDKLVVLDYNIELNNEIINTVVNKQAVPGVIPVKILLTNERLVYTPLYKELLISVGKSNVYSVYNNLGSDKFNTYILETDIISAMNKSLLEVD